MTSTAANAGSVSCRVRRAFVDDGTVLLSLKNDTIGLSNCLMKVSMNTKVIKIECEKQKIVTLNQNILIPSPFQNETIGRG